MKPAPPSPVFPRAFYGEFSRSAGILPAVAAASRRRCMRHRPSQSFHRSLNVQRQSRPKTQKASLHGWPSSHRGKLYAATSVGVVISAPVSVMTSGQALHAASPDCKCHRHCGRIGHSGSTKFSAGALTTSGCSSRMRSTIPHFPSVHWMHAARLHVLLNRNRFSGDRPWRATFTNASLITMRSFENATDPSASTIPIRLAPASHSQLGHRIVDSVMWPLTPMLPWFVPLLFPLPPVRCSSLPEPRRFQSFFRLSR